MGAVRFFFPLNYMSKGNGRKARLWSSALPKTSLSVICDQGFCQLFSKLDRKIMPQTPISSKGALPEPCRTRYSPRHRLHRRIRYLSRLVCAAASALHDADALHAVSALHAADVLCAPASSHRRRRGRVFARYR